MNCEPGDLARIIDLPGPSRAGISDRIIRVTLLDVIEGTTAWRYEGPMLITRDGECVHAITDECLRPIRDPGDDAVDESLAWLPVPEKAHA